MIRMAAVALSAVMITAAVVWSGGPQPASNASSTSAVAGSKPVTAPATQPAAAGGGSNQQSGDISFADGQKDLDLHLRQDQTASETVTVVSRKTEATASLQFYINIKGAGGFLPCVGSVSAATADTSVEANKQRDIPLVITSCSAKGGEGTLGIVGSTGQKRTLRVILHPRRSAYLASAVVVALAIGIVVCFICGLIAAAHGHRPGDQMGKASWDFGSSWASNVTVFGTGVTFLLQLTVFPDKPFLGTRAEYTFLAAFASALVAFAPAVHRMLSSPTVDTSSGSPVVVPQGLVGGFLTACAFTVWGALLQVAIELLLVVDLILTVTLYCPIGIIVAVCIGLTGLGLIVYCWTSILSIIAANATRTGVQTAHLATFSAAALPRPVALNRRVSVL